MKKEDMIAIGNMRLQGKSAGAIAAALGLSVNTVKSYLRRHPDMGCTHFCPQCGKPVMQAEGRKEKKFCSDKCRNKWWIAHLDKVDRRVIREVTCAGCGKTFSVYGQAARKYCSHACYIRHRFGGGADE